MTKNNFSKFILVLLSLYFSFFIQEVFSAQKVTDFKAFEEKLKSIASSPFSRQRVKYIYFFLNRKKVNNVQYFSRMLEEFLLTLNIRGSVYSIEDSLLIAIVNMDAEVNTEFLKNHFEGAFEDVVVRFAG